MESSEERAHSAALQIYEEIGLSKFSIERVEEIIAERLNEQKEADATATIKVSKGSWRITRDTYVVTTALFNDSPFLLTGVIGIYSDEQSAKNKMNEYFDGLVEEFKTQFVFEAFRSDMFCEMSRIDKICIKRVEISKVEWDIPQ